MIVEVPSVYLGIGYYEGLALILWIVSVVLLFIGFIGSLLKARNLEMKTQRVILMGYGIFGLLFGLARVFFFLGFFNPPLYDLYTNLGYISGLLGIICLLYILETYLIKQTKRVFLYITLLAFAISLVSLFGVASRYFALLLISILVPFSILIVIILYIYLIIKTTGDLRKKALGFLIGLNLISVGYLMDTEVFLSSFSAIPLVIAPTVMIAGIFIFLMAQSKS